MKSPAPRRDSDWASKAVHHTAGRSDGACAVTLIVSVLLATPWLPVRAQTISLGEAQNTAVLGSSTVTNTGATTVVGNLALSPGSSVTGFNPPGKVIDGAIHINDALAVQAHADAFTAYTTLAGEAQTANLSGTNLGGMILTPGVYRFDSTAQLTGTLFLDTRNDPNGTFIFQIGSSLATGPNSAVTLLGASGSDPNIFWQVGSSATIGINTIFGGNIVALTSISLAARANITLGRALAINGAVTMDTNVINSTGALITGVFWNGGAGNLWSGANWSPDTTGGTSSTLLPGFDVVFSVTGIVPQNQNTVLDVNEAISSLTVNDAVAVTISGPNTLSILGSGLTRGITINNGAGLVTINSDLQLGGQSQGITVNNVAGLVINGMVSGTIGLTKAGSGLLTLTAAEGYTGSTLITAGTLQLGDGITAGTSIASSGPVTIDGGAVLALDLKSGETFGNAVTDGGLVTTIAPGTNALSGVISGAGAFAQNGIGLSILSGANTYTGGTTVASGVLSVASDANLGGLSGGLTLEGGELLTTAAFSSLRTITLNPTLRANTLAAAANTTATYLGILSGNGGLLVGEGANTGTVVLTATNTYIGGTTIRAGRLQIGNGGTTGSIVGNVLDSPSFLVSKFIAQHEFPPTDGSCSKGGTNYFLDFGKQCSGRNHPA